MREQGVALEHGVDVALVRRHVVDPITEKHHVAGVGRLKAADDAQRRGLAAAGGAEQRQKLVVIDIQVDVVENLVPVVGLGDILELNDLLVFVHVSSFPRG